MNLGFGMPLVGSTVPGLSMTPRKRSWQSRLYDRMMPDQQGPFAIGDDDKKALVKQGLLQLGIGLLQNNTLAGGLGQGLQGGLLSMQEGTHGLRNDRYQQQMMQRTMAGMDRNNRLESLQGELVGPDGRIDEAKFRQFATMDPQGAKAFREAIDPQTRWQLGRVGDGAGGEVDVLFDPMDPSKMRTLDGQALATPQQGQMGGAGGAVMDQAYQGATAPDQVQQTYSLLAGAYPGAQISSRQRTPQHNAEVGGVPNSQHISGTAADFVIPPQQRPAFIADARKRGFEALDEGDHVHLELPPQRKAGIVPPRIGTRPAKAKDDRQPTELERRLELAKSMGASPDEIKRLVLGNAAPSTKDALGGKALPLGAVNSLTKDAAKLSNLQELTSRFADDFAGNRVGGSVENMLGRLGAPGVTEGQPEWWQQYDRYKNEVRNELFGASLTAGEQAAFEAADITPNMAPAVVRKNLAKQAQLIQQGLQRKGKTWSAQGYNRDAIQEATGVELEAPKQANARDKMPAKPQTDADFARLPKGALYIDPDDGKTYRKP